ncbi:amidohydrolase family protein [Bradyrhizobium sp. 143]|nr:amidohydrolase family protein [Bradyrhizobium sp. 143]MCK1725728.1 amidohydrolase family protein [Bradyrhizobium sp. 142]
MLRLGVPLVIDHMGNPDAREGPDGVAFVRIVDLLADGALWMKLVLCRLSAGGSDYARIRPLHDRVVERAPNRLVWGSVWPYVRVQPAPDAGRLADLFQEWIDDGALIRRILVVNPASLYDFNKEEQA